MAVPQRSCAPREDRYAHLIGAHAAVRSAMTNDLPLDLHDRRRALAVEEPAHLADAPTRDRRIAASEQPGRDQLLAIEEREDPGPTPLDVPAHEIRMVGVKEHQARLAGERVAQQRAQVLVVDEIHELVGIGRGVAVVRGEQDERVAPFAVGERAAQVQIESRRLRRGLRAARTVEVRRGIEPGPIGVDVWRAFVERLPQPHAHGRGQDVAEVVRLGRVHSRHRLHAEELGLDERRRQAAFAQPAMDRRDLHVGSWIDARVVEIRATPRRGLPPAEHLRHLSEFLEPDEVGDVPVLERRARRVHRGDRRGRGRGKYGRRLHELRALAPSRAIAELGEERRVAAIAVQIELPLPEAVDEDHDDAARSVAQRGIEIRERRRILRLARAEHVEHRRRDVQQSASVVVGWDEAARAQTLDERLRHPWTILPRDAHGPRGRWALRWRRVHERRRDRHRGRDRHLGRKAFARAANAEGRALAHARGGRTIRAAGVDQLPRASRLRRHRELRGRGAAAGGNGADDVRRATREQVAGGASVIKLFSTGGVLGEGAGPELAQYTLDETRAAVEEAHRAGIRITTHAHGAEGMRIACEAGIDSIEHCTLLDAQTIKLIKEKDVALVPTFSALHAILENAVSLNERVMERARAVAAKHHEGVRAAHKAGVRIAAGTDGGTPFNKHERYALELRYLHETGLSREESLVAATSRAADVVGRPQAGRIAEGCWADFVFVDADPLKDLEVLLDPKAVWVRGTPAAP